jgi:hypothetical protein
MVQKVVETAYDPKYAGKVTYHDRLAASKFANLPLDNSIKSVVAIQKALTATAPEQGKPSSRPKFNNIPDSLTDTQRRSYGRSKK